MKKIKLDHIAKIEGRLDFVADIVGGKTLRAKLTTYEGARLIEGILVGRNFSEAPIITSRICGICPVVHNLCAIEALEAALGVKVSLEIKELRKLMQYAQLVHSHGLHLFFLSFPDFVGISNDIDLVKNYPREAKKAIQVRDFALKIIKNVGGRAIHPITTEIGGFKKVPVPDIFGKILADFDKTYQAAWDLAKLFARLDYPIVGRENEYISLTHASEYAIYEGDIVSTQESKMSVRNFFNSLEERQKIYNPEVKRVKFKNRIYMVGALARINNNFKKLCPPVRELWRVKSQEKIVHNNFLNIYAQAVEVVHCLFEIEKILQKFAKHRIKNYQTKFKIKAGEGIHGIEAPRGLLFHYYKLDSRGRIVKSECVTPTLQFLDNLERDLEVYLRSLGNISAKERRARIRTLIRAYDLCISCATH